jgi:adenosine kinase
MNKNYKIIVLGPIPRDHITTYEGQVVEKYGCALYPVVALSQLAGDRSEIIPVTHVQQRDSEPIKAILASFSNVKTDHINSELNQGDVISLKYVTQSKRIECQTAFMAPILPADVKDLLDADAYVFVPVTDFEVALDTLKHIKKNSDGVIIFDAHGPTNSCTRKGNESIAFG